MVDQEGVNAGEDTVMTVCVPPLLKGYRTVVEDVKEDLVSTTEGTQWGLELLPQAQVLVVRQGVGGGVQGKLEGPLW